MANTVSCIVLLLIGAVLAPGKLLSAKPFHNLPAFHAEQRPDDIASDRLHPCKPLKPRTAKQMKQHGFRLIIPVMSYRDSIAAMALRLSLKHFIPAEPARLLQSELFPRGSSSDLPEPAPKGDPQLPAELFYKFLIPIRLLLTQTMVHMNSHKLKIQLLPKLQQHKKQTDGIRTA